MAVMMKTMSLKTGSDAGEQRRRRAKKKSGKPPWREGDGDEDEDEECSSTAGTSETKSYLRRRAAAGGDRPRSSLGTVKIEEFYGDRARYIKWKKAIEAQAELYRLEDAELAMLVYLSTKKDARDCCGPSASTRRAADCS